jgi:SAM-dependent methyltransferase
VHLRYWEDAAARWHEEIFDSLAEDRSGIVHDTLRDLAARGAVVADFGCGVGGYLPFLATHFDRVVAFDWAASCVAQARSTAGGHANVEVHRSTPRTIARFRESSDVTIAMNVFIDARRQARRRALRQAVSLTRPGGRVVVLVPSLESVVYSDAVRRAFRPGARADYGFAATPGGRDPGVVAIDGVPTKHYVGDELRLLLESTGCATEALHRVEYSWDILHAAPPDGFGGPGPWDWLAIARRD